ncbi:hypothetical protein [Thomasclavelia spiroformis]|uniref:hypothetical protein n=1 Tax=Thomasclavelia spiroformis TaxID=29348 RepID=UPI00241CBEB5|nr:hypothetical protein [Thomasclavelia spiroformis]MBS6115936.1 hypothetical protein [Thomasclavelia spiroformis]
MKEYKIWKFIPGKYLQKVTVSLEEKYPCKQKRCGYSCLGDKTERVCFVKANLFFEERAKLRCTASDNKEHKNFIHIRLLHRIFIDE